MESRQKRAIGITVAIGIVLILLVIIFTSRYVCGGTDGMERVACMRDMAIIILMFETFIAILLIAVMVVLVAMLTMTVQEQVVPILNSAQQTVRTVETTTNFVSDTVVSPIIRVHQTVAGVQGFLVALFARRKPHGQTEPTEGPKQGGINSNE